jgi:hypothetical protein
VTPELEDGGWCHRRRREMTTRFGGRGRERSGGRGADVFQPEMRERDGGKGGSKLQNGKGTQRCEHVVLGGATEEERGGGGPAAGIDPTPLEMGGVSHVGAGEGEGKACRWAGPRGEVQLAVGRGYGRWALVGKRKKEKENGLNSNWKLIF